MKLKAVIVLFIAIMIASANAYAISGKHPLNNIEKTKHLNKINNSKVKIKNIKNNKITSETLREKMREKAFENAKKKYEIWLNKYKRIHAKNPKNFTVKKQMILAGLNSVEKWLEMIKAKTNGDLAEKIDKTIEKITTLKEEVNTSKTQEDLKKIRNAWMDIRKDIREIALSFAIQRIENVIEKAENLELKLEIIANKTESKKLIEDYRHYIQKAREKVEDATKLLNDDKMLDARISIEDAIKYLKLAFMKIKEIVRLKGHLFFGYETGEAFVDINGSVNFKGSAVIVVKGDATITASNAVVKAVGFTKSIKDNTTVLTGKGKAVIRGKNISVDINGNFKVFIKGNGILKINGSGIYRVKPTPSKPMSDIMQISQYTEIVLG